MCMLVSILRGHSSHHITMHVIYLVLHGKCVLKGQDERIDNWIAVIAMGTSSNACTHNGYTRIIACHHTPIDEMGSQRGE